MRHTSRWILCLAWVVSGCSRDAAPLPTAPAVVVPQADIGLPYFNSNWRVPDVFRPIAAGDVISQRVTSEDPPCDPGTRCQFYRYEASRDGVFTVAMTWSSSSPSNYPLDIDVTNSEGWTQDCVVNGPQRSVILEVHTGTYWVTVWSSPSQFGEPFILTTSFAPK